MLNYMDIKTYDITAVASHPLYQKNHKAIKERGLDSFLTENGIFGGIVPFIKHPNEGGELISISFEMHYRTTKKDKEKWNMGFYEEREISKDEREATTKLLLKAFDLITEWNTQNIPV